MPLSPVSTIAVSNLLIPNLFFALCLAYIDPNVLPRLFLWGLFVLMSLPGLVHLPGDANCEYIMDVIVSGSITYALHILLISPLVVYHYNIDKTHPHLQPFFKRLYWPLAVIISARGIGWN
jgi:hypothetical protein